MKLHQSFQANVFPFIAVVGLLSCLFSSVPLTPLFIRRILLLLSAFIMYNSARYTEIHKRFDVNFYLLIIRSKKENLKHPLN